MSAAINDVLRELYTVDAMRGWRIDLHRNVSRIFADDYWIHAVRERIDPGEPIYPAIRRHVFWALPEHRIQQSATDTHGFVRFLDSEIRAMFTAARNPLAWQPGGIFSESWLD